MILLVMLISAVLLLCSLGMLTRLISFPRSFKALCSILAVTFIIQIISLGIFPATLSSANVFMLEVTVTEYQDRVGGRRK